MADVRDSKLLSPERLDAAEDGARRRLADVEGELEQLGRALDLLAGDDPGDAQVELGEILDADGRGDRLAAGKGQDDAGARRRLGVAARRGGSNRASSCFGSTRCIRCW